MKKLLIMVFALGAVTISAHYEDKAVFDDDGFELIAVPKCNRESEEDVFYDARESQEDLGDWVIMDESYHRGMSPIELAVWEGNRQGNKVVGTVVDSVSKNVEKTASQAGDAMSNALDENIDGWFEGAKQWIVGLFN